MSKQSDNVILMPGEAGWEIWSSASSKGLTLVTTVPTSRASEVHGLPAGEVIMLFPVRSFTALPLKVTTEDASLFPELASLHAERLGLRPDPMAGQLTDQFIVAKEGENTALLSVILKAPMEGDLPARGPKEFDLSARAFVYQGESLVIWKEFGRWVFALSVNGKLVYCQATSIDSAVPDQVLVREIRLAVIQLSLQGLDCQPSRVIVYGVDSAAVDALGSSFGAPVEALPKPPPVLPEPRSRLLPADVRAARRDAQKKQRIFAGIAALVIAYLGLAGWFGYKVWQDAKETKVLRQAALDVAPEQKAYSQHLAKWDELSQVVDNNRYPVEVFLRIYRAIPKAAGLRLKSAQLTGGSIKLDGDAPQAKAVNDFSLNLTKKELAEYQWQTPPAKNTPKGWDFTFSAQAPWAEGTKP